MKHSPRKHVKMASIQTNFLQQKNLPRGIRNNNPGNLKKSSIRWFGKIESSDSVFEQFVDIRYGIRALAKDITNDIKKGKNTIAALISEFAPATENKTRAYINYVSQATGIDENARLNTEFGTIFRLVKAIIRHENGEPAKLIKDSWIEEGITKDAFFFDLTKVNMNNIVKYALSALLALVAAFGTFKAWAAKKAGLSEKKKVKQYALLAVVPIVLIPVILFWPKIQAWFAGMVSRFSKKK